MATVIWTKKAHNCRDKFYFEGMMEFGIMTANKTDHIIGEIEQDLSKWPTAGFPEPLLKGTAHLYRARHINKRYKLIYRYEETTDIVYIEDIWDTRRNPESLKKRIR